MLAKVKPYAAVFSGVPFALVYGAFARIVFGAKSLSDLFGTLSIAFLLLVPIAIGALTVYFAPAEKRTSGIYAFFMPWLSCVIGAALAGLLAFEYSVCIAMALPIMFTMASFGGIVTWFVANKVRKSNPQILGLILLAPFIAAPLENRFPVADSYRTVHTQIEINASEAVIWQNIIRVGKIHDAERPFSVIFDLFGAPKPLEAQLSHDGAGAMRRGVFAGGLAFNEQITRWEPNKRLDFEISAENDSVSDALTSLAPWHEIGGRYFSVPQASYVLESKGNGKVILRLSSTHRLTTRFNDYGGLWTDWGMADFQNHILQVIKTRCESQK